jgi:hypothetical protein
MFADWAVHVCAVVNITPVRAIFWMRAPAQGSFASHCFRRYLVLSPLACETSALRSSVARRQTTAVSVGRMM